MTPSILGSDERDVLTVENIAHGLGTTVGTYRERTLDGIFGDAPRRIGLIHLGSLTAAKKVLDGARRLIAEHRPTILIGSEILVETRRGIEELLGLSGLLGECGYSFYDSLLNPLTTPGEFRDALDLWFESVFFALPAGSKSDTTEIIRSYRRNAALFRATTSRNTTLRADQFRQCHGFYPAESWNDVHWRWTGPLPCASVTIPLGPPGRYRLTCRLLKVADQRVLESLRIFVNGRPLVVDIQADEFEIRIAGTFGLGPADYTSLAEVRFVHSDTFIINPDGPRRLGLALLEIGLERQP